MDTLDANPLIAQLKRQPTRLTLRRTLWLGFGLGLLSLGISTAAVLTTRAQQFGLLANLLFTTGWLITALTPFLTAVTAAALTRRTLRPERFDLVRLTPLENRTLLHALVFAALFRMRLVYLVLVIVMPVLVVEAFFALVTIDVPAYYYLLNEPPYWEIVGPTLVAVAIIVDLWIMNLLGAAVGVRAGVLQSRTQAAAATAVLKVLIAMGGLYLGCLGVVSWAPGDATVLTQYLFLVLMPLVLILLPYALAAQAIRSTGRAWRR